MLFINSILSIRNDELLKEIMIILCFFFIGSLKKIRIRDT